MKTVVWRSTQALECVCTLNAPLVLCLSSSLTASGAPFVQGTLSSYVCSGDICGKQTYSYYVSYDSSLLADPSYSLTSADITGGFCKNCLTDYIEYLVAHIALPV